MVADLITSSSLLKYIALGRALAELGGGTRPTGNMYKQAPSMTDINSATGRINYEFGRHNGNIYIFNRSGVIGIINQKRLKD